MVAFEAEVKRDHDQQHHPEQGEVAVTPCSSDMLSKFIQ
jgi:hypothetical protein